MAEGILRPPTLTLPSDVPPLPAETLAMVQATTLEWLKVRTATSPNLRRAITDLEKFDSETGELNHILKGGDRVMAQIASKEAGNLIDPADASALRAALVCRVKRKVLNLIQADEETPWDIVKERLKKAFGGGRWSPEEDIFQMFREMKQPRQTNGQYAGILLMRYKKITEKMRETASIGEVEARMAVLSTILKVQLARDTGKKEGLSSDKTFVECAQEMGRWERYRTLVPEKRRRTESGVGWLDTASLQESLQRATVRCTDSTCCPPGHKCCNGGTRCCNGMGRWFQSISC